MRVAIVTGDYHKPGQTFVNRHIEHLFGGNTCVVANGFNGVNPFDKHVFAHRQIRRPFPENLASPFMKAVQRRRYGSSRLPWGARRKALETFLRDQEIALILAEFGTEALTVIDTAEAMGLPMFTYFRGTDASYSLRQPTRVAGYARMFPRLTGVVAVSQFLMDNLAAHGLTHPNSHVIPSGVDVRRFQPREKVPGSFLAVGRMIEKKAPQVSLRAFAKATANRPDARLTFIGDGPERAPCEALAAELDVREKVIFTGEQAHEVVRDHLERTAVFLQHSVPSSNGTTEGLPTAIQEALACGCIVISTRHAGIPEAIDHGENGWLCDEHDEAAYTDLVARSLTADTDAMSRAARATAETRFDNAVLLTKLETIFRESVPAG